MNTKQTSINTVIRKGRTNAKREALVFLRITRMGKSSYRSLGLQVNPKEWNKTEGRVRRSHPNSVRFNNFIEHYIDEAQLRIQEEQLKNDEAEAGLLKASLARRKNKTLQELIDEKVEDLCSKASFNSMDKYTVLKNKLYRRNKEKETAICNVDLDYLTRFERHMRADLGNKPNTIHASMKCLRFFCNEAVKFWHLEARNNPFNLYKPKRVPTDIPYLTAEQVARLSQLNLATSSKLFI